MPLFGTVMGILRTYGELKAIRDSFHDEIALDAI